MVLVAWAHPLMRERRSEQVRYWTIFHGFATRSANSISFGFCRNADIDKARRRVGQTFRSGEPCLTAKCGRRQVAILSLRFAHGDHSFEFLSSKTKIQGHLFKLLLTIIIGRFRAEAFDPGSKVKAPHLLWSFMPIGALTIRLLEHAQLTQYQIITSFHDLHSIRA